MADGTLCKASQRIERTAAVKADTKGAGRVAVAMPK